MLSYTKNKTNGLIVHYDGISKRLQKVFLISFMKGTLQDALDKNV